MHTPKVSIGLPVYNGEKYLRFALDSILQQDYVDFELILSDNASNDETANICRSYAEKDSRIRYHRFDVNQGASRNFTAVFEMARGEYFKWAAYDDVCLPGFLSKCVSVLDQAPPTVLVAVPRTQLIDESGQAIDYPEPVEPSDIRQARPYQRLATVVRTVFWAPGQYGVIRVEALRKTRLLEPFIKSDFALIAELALQGQIWEIPETLLQLRIHRQTAVCPHLDEKAHLLWFDPSRIKGKDLLGPLTRIGWEYMRSIGRLDLPFSERILCCLTVAFAWSPREGRRLLQVLRNRIALKTRVKHAIRRWSEKSIPAR